MPKLIFFVFKQNCFIFLTIVWSHLQWKSLFWSNCCILKQLQQFLAIVVFMKNCLAPAVLIFFWQYWQDTLNGTSSLGSGSKNRGKMDTVWVLFLKVKTNTMRLWKEEEWEGEKGCIQGKNPCALASSLISYPGGSWLMNATLQIVWEGSSGPAAAS